MGMKPRRKPVAKKSTEAKSDPASMELNGRRFAIEGRFMVVSGDRSTFSLLDNGDVNFVDSAVMPYQYGEAVGEVLEYREGVRELLNMTLGDILRTRKDLLNERLFSKIKASSEATLSLGKDILK